MAPAPSPEPPIATAPPSTEALNPDAGFGEWVESTAYKIKVASIQRCADVEGAPSDAARSMRIGVTVHIMSLYDEFFAAPRDLTIEKGGIIIPSEINPKPSAGCTPLLQPTSMRHDQVMTGVVPFQIADESLLDSAVVAFKPTRWGGAPRVEVKITKSNLNLAPKGSAAQARPKTK